MRAHVITALEHSKGRIFKLVCAQEVPVTAGKVEIERVSAKQRFEQFQDEREHVFQLSEEPNSNERNIQ